MLYLHTNALADKCIENGLNIIIIITEQTALLVCSDLYSLHTIMIMIGVQF